MDFHQTAGVYIRINLGAGQAGMTEQFLDGTKIAAARQQMCCERMAQGMGCHAFRQTEGAA